MRLKIKKQTPVAEVSTYKTWEVEHRNSVVVFYTQNTFDEGVSVTARVVSFKHEERDGLTNSRDVHTASGKDTVEAALHAIDYNVRASVGWWSFMAGSGVDNDIKDKQRNIKMPIIENPVGKTDGVYVTQTLKHNKEVEVLTQGKW